MDEEQALASTFLSQLSDSLKQQIESLNNLEEILQNLVNSAQCSWPGVDVSSVKFVAFLAKRMPEDTSVIESFSSLRIADLYLVHACLEHNHEALNIFSQQVLAKTDAALSSILKSSMRVADLKQSLLQQFFTGNGDSPPTMLTYSGRKSLRNWVYLVAVRKALTLHKRAQKECFFPKEAFEQISAIEDDPELAYLKQLYQKEFTTAFQKALLSLSCEERNLLRYHTLDGLNIDQIGFIFRIHRATAARWIEKVRRKLMINTRQILLQNLHLKPTEYESIMRLIQSQLYISIKQYLHHDEE